MDKKRGEMVRAFNAKFGFEVDLELPELSASTKIYLKQIIESLHVMADTWRNAAVSLNPDDHCNCLEWRLHLQLQEEAEIMEAILERDKVKLADAIADKQYVLEGTGQRYGIPTDYVFAEVHRSNMTKTFDIKSNSEKGRGKGEGYVPPDIEGAIARGREVMRWEQQLREEQGE